LLKCGILLNETEEKEEEEALLTIKKILTPGTATEHSHCHRETSCSY